jgi:hypothetical protein
MLRRTMKRGLPGGLLPLFGRRPRTRCLQARDGSRGFPGRAVAGAPAAAIARKGSLVSHSGRISEHQGAAFTCEPIDQISYKWILSRRAVAGPCQISATSS